MFGNFPGPIFQQTSILKTNWFTLYLLPSRRTHINQFVSYINVEMTPEGNTIKQTLNKMKL